MVLGAARITLCAPMSSLPARVRSLSAASLLCFGLNCPGAFAETPHRTVEEIVSLVEQHCGSCHPAPRPDVMPRDTWPKLINTMAEIARQRAGKEVIPPDVVRDISALYYGSSPEKLPRLPILERGHPSIEFVRRDVGAPAALPMILDVAAVALAREARPQFLVSDGAQKKLSLLDRTGQSWRETPLAPIDIPIRTQTIDFDADGDLDILVADLGLMPPVGALAGKIVLLRQDKTGKFAKEILQEKLHRVSDARALDLDGDGDLDIAVAEFGGADRGSIFWLENAGAGKYERHTLLQLSGALNVTPADIDGDGKLDLVSLVAQEHEMLVAFMASGDGKFETRILMRAPHPMFGSTSMKVVDLDRDGDVDILFSNGDAFDLHTDPKPYHGVQWVENDGKGAFRYHDIGRFYGASDAEAADLDGDGDLDVVASSWVTYWNEPGHYALVWFENDGRQRFTPHPISNRPAGLTTLQIVDVNGDGAPDILAGAMRMDLMFASLGGQNKYEGTGLFPDAKSHPGPHPRVLLFEQRKPIATGK